MLEMYVDYKLRLLKEIRDENNETTDNVITIVIKEYDWEVDGQSIDPYRVFSELFGDDKKIAEVINEIEVTNRKDGLVYLFEDIEILNKKEFKKKLDILISETEPLSKKLLSPIIPNEILEPIAKIMDETRTETQLINYFKKHCVPEELFIYPDTTNWEMTYNILEYLAVQDNSDYNSLLLKLIGNFPHPLTHNGNFELAKEVKCKFDRLLTLSDFCMDEELKNLIKTTSSNFQAAKIPKKDPLRSFVKQSLPENKSYSVQFQDYDGNLCWGNEKLKFERGRKKILSELFGKRKEIRRNGTKQKGGESTSIAILQNKGNYKSEQQFRGALNKIRRRLRSSKIPIDIPSNSRDGNYILVVDYSKIEQ